MQYYNWYTYYHSNKITTKSSLMVSNSKLVISSVVCVLLVEVITASLVRINFYRITIIS